MSLYLTSTIANNRVSYLDLDIDIQSAHKDQFLVYRKFSLSSVYALNNTPSSDLVQTQPSVDEIKTLYSLPSASASGSGMFTVDEATHEIVFSTTASDFMWKGNGVHHSRLNQGVAYDIQLPTAATGDTVQILRKTVIDTRNTTFSNSTRIRSIDLRGFSAQIIQLIEEALIERKTPSLSIRVGNPSGITPLDTDKIIPIDRLRTDVMTGLKATATITFSGTSSVTVPAKTITIISTPTDTDPLGKSVTYIAASSNGPTDNEFNVTTSVGNAATTLAGCINHLAGHNGKIVAEAATVGSTGVVTLTQKVGGIGGVTVITETVENCSVVSFAQTPPSDITTVTLQGFSNVDYGHFISATLDKHELKWDGNASWRPVYPLFSALGISEASALANKDNWIVYYNGTSLDLKEPLINILTDVTATNDSGAQGPVTGQMFFADTTTSWDLTKKASITTGDVLEWDTTNDTWFFSQKVWSSVPTVPGFLYGGEVAPFPDVTGNFGDPWEGTAAIASGMGDINSTVSLSPLEGQLLVWDTSLTNTVNDTVLDENGAWTNKHVNLYDISKPTGTGDATDCALEIQNYTDSQHGLKAGDMLVHRIVDASSTPKKTKLEIIDPFDYLAERYAGFSNTQSDMEVGQMVVALGGNDLDNKTIATNDLPNVQTLHTDGTTGPAHGAKLTLYANEGANGTWKPTAWDQGTVNTGDQLEIAVEINQTVDQSQQNWLSLGNTGAQVHMAQPYRVPRAMKITGMRMNSIIDPTGAQQSLPMQWGVSNHYHLGGINQSASFDNGNGRMQGWKIYKRAGSWDSTGEPNGSATATLISKNAAETTLPSVDRFAGIINLADIYYNGSPYGSVYDFNTMAYQHPFLGGGLYYPLGTGDVTLAAGEILLFEYWQTTSMTDFNISSGLFPVEQGRIQQRIELICEEI